MLVRSATSSDIDDIIEMERECPEAAHWTRDQYASATERQGHPQRFAWAAEDEASGKLLGFLVAHKIDKDWELENMAVCARARRRGIGRMLLHQLIDQSMGEEGHRILLEVRESNQAARALYKAFNFCETGVRKGYYTDPLEDAVLYCRNLA